MGPLRHMIREALLQTGDLIDALTVGSAWYNALDRKSDTYRAALEELQSVEPILTEPPSLLAAAKEIASRVGDDEELGQNMLLERMDAREHPELANAIAGDIEDGINAALSKLAWSEADKAVRERFRRSAPFLRWMEEDGLT